MQQKVVFVKEFPAIPHAKRKIGPFEIGDEVMLNCWEAKVLEKHGFLERKKISLGDLRSILVSEERSQGPMELPKGFYFLLKSEMSVLRAAGDTKAMEELKKMTLALLHARLPKLLVSALSPDEARNIQAEERFLVNRLAQIVECWMNDMKSFLEGEEVDEHGGGHI